MPGPIVHLIVQQRLSEYVQGFDDGDKFARLLDEDRCSPYAAFGSQGPDFLFFSLKEYGTGLDEFANFLFGVYDALEPLISFYEDTIEPIETAVDGALSAVDEAVFSGIFGDIKATSSLLTETALTAAAKVLTDKVDLFYQFHPKIQEGAPESEWYWFDFLHYRRTGQFATNLWKLADSDADLKRYALGYTSHIGTDVVGHPFVNAIVGGPFRTHWHRHKMVENWIDAYARNHYDDPNSLIGCLNLGRDDHYLRNNIAGSYYGRLCRFPDGKMPEKLQNLLTRAIEETFVRDNNGGAGHPPPLSGRDFDTTYRLWLKWFERATEIGSGQPPTPVPPPGAATADLFRGLVRSLPSPPGSGSGSPSGGFSILGALAALFALAKWLAEVVAKTIEWIITNAVDILTLPFTEAKALVKWLIYQVRKGIWEIYDSLRFALVLGGYLFPEARDLNKHPYGRAFINTDFTHLTNGLRASGQFRQYPFREEDHGDFGPTEHHLVYPGLGFPPRENPPAEPMPLPFHGQNPEAFISGVYPFDSFIESLYDCTEPYGTTVKATHHVDQMTWHTPQLGSALTFSARLIAERLEKGVPNFNLDGDRGYGWKTWRPIAEDVKLDFAGDPTSRNPRLDVFYIDP